MVQGLSVIPININKLGNKQRVGKSQRGRQRSLQGVRGYRPLENEGV